MWIPTSERLPDVGVDVLICWAGKDHVREAFLCRAEVLMDYFRSADGQKFYQERGGFFPTHWMPMPEPPK